jgi:cation diffusion facilitator family transporter
MHIHTLDRWQHNHIFHMEASDSERRTFWVVVLTAVMMVVEIIAGTMYGSMALLADGWHMGTHVAALSIALFTYRYTKKHAFNPKFSFGTGKVNSLGGFASAVSLGVVALMIGADSIQRFFAPEKIHYNEAITVAVIGLIVNLASAWLLQGSHEHGHSHGHDHGHSHAAEHHHHHDAHEPKKGEKSHHDQNLRAAYMHVLADALTSVLAIVALLFGKSFGLVWMDAAMGVVGAIVIARWSFTLLKETSVVLLDNVPGEDIINNIKTTIEADADNRVTDLHIWRIGAKHHAAIIALATHSPQKPEHYKHLLSSIKELSHVTIEVNSCEGESCLTT